jgi:hypothetical protein
MFASIIVAYLCSQSLNISLKNSVLNTKTFVLLIHLSKTLQQFRVSSPMLTNMYETTYDTKIRKEKGVESVLVLRKNITYVSSSFICSCFLLLERLVDS